MRAAETAWEASRICKLAICTSHVLHLGAERTRLFEESKLGVLIFHPSSFFFLQFRSFFLCFAKTENLHTLSAHHHLPKLLIILAFHRLEMKTTHLVIVAINTRKIHARQRRLRVSRVIIFLLKRLMHGCSPI